jgi:DNA-binding NarL/FixJ family response regulator
MYVPVDSHTVSVYVSATARKLNTKYTTRSALLAGVRGTRIWRIV